MIPVPDLIAFTLSSVALIVIPGPSVLFVIGRSLTYGKRGGLMSVLGNGLGGLPLVAAVAIGVGSIIAQSVALFTIIKVIGAAYLIYLGIQAVRHRKDGDSAAASTLRRPAPRALLQQGFIVGLTNPKTMVFFAAVLPQFVSLESGAVPLQMMMLGLVFVAIGVICDSAWALLAGSARSWFARTPRRLPAVRAVGGSAMIVLGGSLVLTSSRT